jgi:hypothetical protein
MIFALASLLQLARVAAGFEVSVDGHLVPLWASAIAFAIAAGLSAWMGQLSYRSAK